MREYIIRIFPVSGDADNVNVIVTRAGDRISDIQAPADEALLRATEAIRENYGTDPL